jgi:protein-L-isoaspartate(D-aspartate) O-methyltransferase
MVTEQLEARDITDPRVLAIMRELPRHAFVPLERAHEAYADRALATEAGQTISQPYIVALMTQALKVEADHRVLEIGTGSGYQCAILARLARVVDTVERFAALSTRARHRLEKLGVSNVTFHVGDGSTGRPGDAPFDRIIVTAAAPSVPTALLEQLVDGGRLVVPIGGAKHQTLVAVERNGTRVVEQPLVACRFVHLIGEGGWRETDLATTDAAEPRETT